MIKSFLCGFLLITTFLAGNTKVYSPGKAIKPFVIVVPSYNNTKWLWMNLHSILNQDYENYRIIYIDDHSPDGTGEVVRDYLNNRDVDFQDIEFDDGGLDYKQIIAKFNEEVNREYHFVTLVRNQNRCGALENIVRAVYSCLDDEIIATIDGDDWTPDNQVLNILNDAYEEDVWLTHGTLIHYPTNTVDWSEPVPEEYIKTNTFRKFKCPSHLRTFYAWLFKAVKMEDLRYKGQFFPMTWDMAMMYPMIEMCGERHAFISDVIYCYNIANQINDNKVNPQLQNDLDKYIRSLPPYKKLESKP